MDLIGIYKITNPNGAVYIGQSVNIKRRFSKYKKLQCEYQRKLFNSLQKYDVNNHGFEIIHELPKDIEQNIMNQYEQFYMNAYRNCGIELLNIREAGSSGTPSPETIEKMHIANKGKYYRIGWKPTKEHIEKVRLSNIGRKKSLEEIEKIRQANIGLKHSEETKLKMSKSKMGHKYLVGVKRPDVALRNKNKSWL